MKPIYIIMMLGAVTSVSACMNAETQPAPAVKKTQLAPPTKSTPNEKQVEPIEKINTFDRSVQLDSKVYANDADAIERLIAMSSRSPEEEGYLLMLSKKYDFYGKPENIPSALIKARQKPN